MLGGSVLLLHERCSSIHICNKCVMMFSLRFVNTDACG
jgi:hypothetical protein